jgi:Flp pilus assembly protein TadG
MTKAVSRRPSERGSVLVVVAVALLMLIGVAALVIDLGVLYAAAQQAQHAADVAALAGAGRLRAGMNPTDAANEAIAVAAQNKILGSAVSLSSSDVVVGAWDAASKQVVAWSSTATAVAVQVTVRRTPSSPNGPVPTFFAQVMGVPSMSVTRASTAGLFVNQRPRNAISLMIVQDGSSSFQSAWTKAINADTGLLNLINGVSMSGDAAGMVTFNAALSRSYLQSAGLWSYYNGTPYNTGLKYTTNTSGVPVKTTVTGVSSPSGLVRQLSGALTGFDPSDHTSLVTEMSNASQLLRNGNAWGDTDTGAGIEYATASLTARTGAPAGTDKVIVVVSDGMPHSVDGSAQTAAFQNHARSAADAAAAAGVRIHVVTLEGSDGVNYAFNESLVRNGGYALRAANADRLFEMLISVGAIEIGRPTLLK